MRKKKITEVFLVAGLALTAALLRAPAMTQGFWYDELISLTCFFRADWLSLLTTMPDPNHHPLYSLLAKLCLLLLGEKEWTVRLPSLVAGSVSVPLLYCFGRRFLGRTAGTTAALLLTFHMWHVYYSTDARGYALMILFSLASWHLFLLLAEKFTPHHAAAYVVVTSGSLYTHLYSCALPGGHLIAALTAVFAGSRALRRERLFLAAPPLAALVVAGFLYLPMLPDLLHFASTQGQITRHREISAGFIAQLFLSWASGSESLIFSLPALAAAAVGVGLWVKEKKFLLLSWLAPLLLAFSFPLLTHTFVYQRFFSFALPGFLLAVGAGVEHLGRRCRLSSWSRAGASALLVFLLLPALYSYFRLGKQGLKAAAVWIEQNAPGARVISLGIAAEVFKYYCPLAENRQEERPLDESLLSDAVVVFAFPWSVDPVRQAQLEQLCGPPRLFPAAGYAENEVRLYRCRVGKREDTGRP